MTKTRLFAAAILLAATVSGCIVRTRRPCHTECWWDHGRRVCEKRCN
jgi:hypothetical protein